MEITIALKNIIIINYHLYSAKYMCKKYTLYKTSIYFQLIAGTNFRFELTQAVKGTLHVTAFDQFYVFSAGAMADTFFVANGEKAVVSRPISALVVRMKRIFSRSCLCNN